jgi:hypothetical protein
MRERAVRHGDASFELKREAGLGVASRGRLLLFMEGSNGTGLSEPSPRDDPRHVVLGYEMIAPTLSMRRADLRGRDQRPGAAPTRNWRSSFEAFSSQLSMPSSR